jgi:cell division transport system permease protein
MLVTLKRIFISGFKNLIRDGGPSIATCFIILIPVALISSFLILKEANRIFIQTLQERADISVYFKIKTEEEQILSLKDEISKIPEVKEVKYVSREEALQKFIEKHGENPALMEALREVGKNPFFASLAILAQKPDYYPKVLNFLENSIFKDEIEKIDYFDRKPLIERIFSITSTFNKIGISLFILTSILALLVTFNTIRLSILNQSEEIKIQKLVGASNWFVRGPFFVQGAISGILAAIICISLFALVFYFIDPKLQIFFPEFQLFDYFKENFWKLFLNQILIGILIGTISSFFAIKKHLEV